MLRSTCTNQMPMSTVLETIKTLGRETVFIFRNFRDTSALFRFELRSWPSVKVKYSPGLQGLTSWLQVQCEGDTIWNAICNKYNFHNMNTIFFFFFKCWAGVDFIRLKRMSMVYSIYTTIQKFGVSKMFCLKEINTLIQQGCINLTKSDSKDNVTYDLYFK